VGIAFIEGIARGPAGEEDVRFLIDSGAIRTLLPEPVWRKIGLEPIRGMEFTLADGTRIPRKVSECHIRLPQGAAHTPVILGQGADEALLGVVTLEILGVVFHPFRRTLEPMRALLAFLAPNDA
jgi:clan AA aspartic protease